MVNTKSNTEIQHLNSDFLKYYSKMDFKEVGELLPTCENEYKVFGLGFLNQKKESKLHKSCPFVQNYVPKHVFLHNSLAQCARNPYLCT